ncbi:MAG: hypothetical protein R2939_18085 [Kofleriaceae bacterium]
MSWVERRGASGTGRSTRMRLVAIWSSSWWPSSEGAVQPVAVDEGPVVGAEILDAGARAVEDDPRVLARRPHVRHEHLAVGAPADDVLALGEQTAGRRWGPR